MKNQVRNLLFLSVIIFMSITIYSCDDPEPDCPDRGDRYLEVHSISTTTPKINDFLNIVLWNDFNEDDLDGNLNVKVIRVFDNCKIDEQDFDITSRYSLPIDIHLLSGVGNCGGYRAGESYVVQFVATATTNSDPPVNLNLAASTSFRISGGGSGGLSTMYAHFEVDYMNASGEGYGVKTQNCYNSIEKSIGIADIKIVTTKTNLAATNIVKDFTWNRDQYIYSAWTVTSEGLQTFISQNRNTNDPQRFYLCGARKFTYRVGGINYDFAYLGLTNLAEDFSLSGSFIFFQSADLQADALGSNVNHPSLYNLIANHETVHSLGRVGEDHHVPSKHTGSLATWCALNDAQTLWNNSSTKQRYFININNDVLEFCETHVNLMRIGSELQDHNGYQGSGSVNNIQSNPTFEDENDVVQLKLQKTVYKKYEPIEILVKYINTGYVSDSIYMMFDDFTNFIDFR